MDELANLLPSASRYLMVKVIAELMEWVMDAGRMTRQEYKYYSLLVRRGGATPPPWQDPLPARKPIETMKYYRPVWPPTWQKPSPATFGKN